MSFPRYPKYKDSGVEWLGEVPEHWGTLPLKAVSTHNDDVIDETTSPETVIVYVDISCVDGVNGINAKETMTFSAAPSRARRRVRHGDVIVSTVRTYLKAIAKIRDPEENLIVSTGFAVIRPRGDLIPDFLGYLVSASYFIEQVIARSTGVSYPAINASELVAIPITLPPISEQTQIASFLDQETAKIDELIAEQRRLMELLTEKVTSLVLASINSTETRELRLECAVVIISRPVIQTSGELYIPLGLFNRGRGLFHKDPREMADMGDSDFFWIENGDLIISGQFAWEGAVALACKEDDGCVVSHRYPVLRGRSGIATTEYLFGLLSTKHGSFLLNENSRGAAGRNRPLNINSLLKEKVPIPDMQTQENVTQAVYWRNNLFEEISRQVELLLERRTALISAAVTGKIDVRIP